MRGRSRGSIWLRRDLRAAGVNVWKLTDMSRLREVWQSAHETRLFFAQSELWRHRWSPSQETWFGRSFLPKLALRRLKRNDLRDIGSALRQISQ